LGKFSLGKWDLGHWDWDLVNLGMGITDRKTIELGLGFLKFGKTIGREMGLGQNLGWENGIYTPPPFRTLNMHFLAMLFSAVCVLVLLGTEIMAELCSFL